MLSSFLPLFNFKYLESYLLDEPLQGGGVGKVIASNSVNFKVRAVLLPAISWCQWWRGGSVAA
jgi:NADPH-dependent curcumin reductase CurA